MILTWFPVKVSVLFENSLCENELLSVSFPHTLIPLPTIVSSISMRILYIVLCFIFLFLAKLSFFIIDLIILLS